MTDDVGLAMQQASIFTLSSIFEGLPNVMIEAISCGLPVVAYKCPTGPRDIITDGYNGFLVDNEDEQAFADRICDLIESEKLRREMGDNALLSAGRYTPEAVFSQWMALFNELKP